MKIFAMTWISLTTILVGDEVRIQFGGEITWKGFFDAGFRPHHVMDGMEFCRQYDVRVAISSEGSPNWLSLNPGTVLFDVGEDDLILGLRIDTSQELSVEEADARLKKFQKIFKKNIKSENTGSIEYSEIDNRYDYGKCSARADMDPWRIRYSLTPSYQEFQYPQLPRGDWKPFIERLVIVYRGDLKNFSDRRQKPIAPPAGYEWYSLAPKVSTPNHETEYTGPEDFVTESHPSTPASVKRSRQKSDQRQDVRMDRNGWWIGFVLLIVGLAIALRIWKKRKRGR
jgi:hypothetical protein